MKHLKILSALLLSILFASCNQGTSTSENGGGTTAGAWVIPSVGTSYIYAITSTDTTATELDTITILATGQHLGGKTNVVSLLDHSTTESDTGFYNIETNGDISFGDGGGTDSLGNPTFTWDTYPTGSRQTTNVTPPVDTIEGGEHFVNSDVRSFVGVENITIADGEFSTLHIHEASIDSSSSPNDSLGVPFSDDEQTDLWFAPSAGLFVKETGRGTENGQTEQEGELQLLKIIKP